MDKQALNMLDIYGQLVKMELIFGITDISDGEVLDILYPLLNDITVRVRVALEELCTKD